MLDDTITNEGKENKNLQRSVSGGWWKKAQANGIIKVNEGNLQSRKGCSSRTSKGEKIKPSGEENNVPMEQIEW